MNTGHQRKTKYIHISILSSSENSTIEKVMCSETLQVCTIKKLNYFKQQPWYSEVSILRLLATVKGVPRYVDHKISLGGELCILTEYIEGVTLESIIVYTTPKWCILHDIAVQLARVLYHAHRLGIRHGDLKPDNVLVKVSSSNTTSDHQVQVYLIDWGFAVLPETLDADTPYSAGSYMYMSPEMCIPGHVQSFMPSLSDDVWAYGMILYELITGIYPYAIGSVSALLRNIYTTMGPRYKSPLRTSPDISSLFDRIFCPRGQRWTIEQVMNHPWIASHKCPRIHKRQRSFSC